MRNSEIAELFIHTNDSAFGSNMSILVRKQDKYVFSYNTPIACIKFTGPSANVLYLDKTKYSSTTSTHRNLIARAAEGYMEIVYVDKIKFKI